jgi:hypothetical protein
MQILAVLILSLSAQSLADDARVADPPVARREIPVGKAACLAANGRWMWPGIPHREGPPGDTEGTCIVQLPDAGKSCTASSQCMGTCLATRESKQTGRGTCSPTNYGAGCISSVEKGKVGPTICSD